MIEIVYGEVVATRWRMWAEQIRKIQGPGVYKIYSAETGRLLYVGMSEDMARRVFDRNHHVVSSLNNIEIEFLGTPNLRIAAHLEEEIITREKPLFNKFRGGEHPSIIGSSIFRPYPSTTESPFSTVATVDPYLATKDV